jgi:hypothetical protein
MLMLTSSTSLSPSLSGLKYGGEKLTSITGPPVSGAGAGKVGVGVGVGGGGDGGGGDGRGAGGGGDDGVSTTEAVLPQDVRAIPKRPDAKRIAQRVNNFFTGFVFIPQILTQNLIFVYKSAHPLPCVSSRFVLFYGKLDFCGR